MKNFHQALLIIAMLCGFSVQMAKAQSPSPATGPSDLYFLSVGVSNHADKNLNNLAAAGDSAMVVANALRAAGARYGLVLKDDGVPGTFVTRDDIHDALFMLKQRVRADRPAAPRILVYMMSHGIADGASRFVMLMPGNLDIQESPVSQKHIFRLTKRTIWDGDILTSLMSFRIDERLGHLDKRLESDLMSDRTGIFGTIEHGKNLFQRDRELRRLSEGYGTRPFENAPIPFVVLFDNCTGGIDTDVAGNSSLLDAIAQVQVEATFDVGRAFFAVEPGSLASTIPLPFDLTAEEDKVEIFGKMRSPIVGPLAVHLKNVLAHRNRAKPMALRDFADQMSKSGRSDQTGELPEPAYAPVVRMESDPLRPDVARVDFIPGVTEPTGTFDILNAMGRTVEPCCAKIQ